MMKKTGRFGMMALLGGLLTASTMGFDALAASGQPSDWQMNLQGGVTAIADEIHAFHDMLNWIIFAVSLFVLALLVAVVVKFNEKSNPVASRTTHHVGLEIAWTIIPVLILVIIAIPSFRLLRNQYTFPKADIVIKATGYQWYWGFAYAKDSGNMAFETRMLTDEDIAAEVKKGAKKETMPRLLAVDNEVVVPVNKVVHVQVTAADVIHAFAVQAFGIKTDAVPGRLNQVWFKATKEGVYYGQCQELCGKDHAFMPFAVRVVSEAAYAEWLKAAQKKYSLNDNATQQVATSAASSRAE